MAQQKHLRRSAAKRSSDTKPTTSRSAGTESTAGLGGGRGSQPPSPKEKAEGAAPDAGRSAPSAPTKARSKSAEPSAASLARRRAHLLSELRDPGTTAARQQEIREELDGRLKDVPTLSHAELQRLGR